MSTLLKPSPMGITLETAKTRLGVSGSADDAQLTSLIQGATSRIEGILHRNIRQGKYRLVIEQDANDETLLLPGGGSFAAPVVTANGAAVAITDVNLDIGEIGIVPPGPSRLAVGDLEPHFANTVYQTTFRRGWLLDEGAVGDSGLVESFELVASALTGESEIVLDAAALADGSRLPDGSTLSLGDEILFVSTSTRDGAELSVSLLGPLLGDYEAGAAVAHVDERVPAAIQDEIFGLVRDAYRADSGDAPTLPAGISEAEGDGYRLKARDAGEVDAEIRSRLFSRWGQVR